MVSFKLYDFLVLIRPPSPNDGAGHRRVAKSPGNSHLLPYRGLLYGMGNPSPVIPYESAFRKYQRPFRNGLQGFSDYLLRMTQPVYGGGINPIYP